MIENIPSALFLWQNLLTHTEFLVMAPLTVLITLTNVLLFCLQRSKIVLSYRALGDRTHSKKVAIMIAAALIPTLSTCLTTGTMLFPRTANMFFALGKILRAGGIYIALIYCYKLCGGRVGLFRLVRLKPDHTMDMMSYNKLHSLLSACLNFLTLELLFQILLHFSLLIYSCNSDDVIYLHRASSSPFLMVYHGSQAVAGLLGIIPARKVAKEAAKADNILALLPIILKGVMLVLVVIEAGCSIVISEPVSADNSSVLEFLVMNSLSAAIIQTIELAIIIMLNRKVICKDVAESEIEEQDREASNIARGNLVVESNNIQISLNRNDSREFLRSLCLPDHSVDYEEGLKLLVSSNRRTRINSISSVATF